MNIFLTDKLEEATVSVKSVKKLSPKKSKRSNAELLAAAESIEDTVATSDAPVAAPRTQFEILEKNAAIDLPETTNSEGPNIMPPPPIVEDTLNKRPQRAAKLKSEKQLKEPPLNTKLRRPTNEIKVKLEHEQRASQMYEANSETAKYSVLTEFNQNAAAKSSSSNEISDDSVTIVPAKEPSIVSLNSNLSDVPSTDASSSSKHSTTDNSKYDFIYIFLHRLKKVVNI